MNNRYLPFLQNGYFDAFTWVPTVQGNLYTAVLDKESIDGQIDKYLVNFKFGGDDTRYEISNHIVASFLIADFDQKLWPNPYSGVFRWILRGSINHRQDYEEFLDHFLGEVNMGENGLPDLKELVQNALIGEPGSGNSRSC